MYNNMPFSHNFTVEVVFLPKSSPNTSEVVGYAFSTTDSDAADVERGRQGWVLYDTFYPLTKTAGTLVMRAPTGPASRISTWSEWVAVVTRGVWPAGTGRTQSLWRTGAQYVHGDWQSTRDMDEAKGLIVDSLPAPAATQPAGTSVGSALPRAYTSAVAAPTGVSAVRPSSSPQPGGGATGPSPRPSIAVKQPSALAPPHGLRARPGPSRPFRCFGWGGHLVDLPDFESGGQFFDKWVLYSGTNPQTQIHLYGTDLFVPVLRDPNEGGTNVEYWLIPSNYAPVQEGYDLRTDTKAIESPGGGSSETPPEDPTEWVIPGVLAGCTFMLAKCTYFDAPPANG
jgi:hypothetical protein